MTAKVVRLKTSEPLKPGDVLKCQCGRKHILLSGDKGLYFVCDRQNLEGQ